MPENDERIRLLYQSIKQEIRSLLISSPKTKYGGLSGSLLYADYKELNCGREIPYGELGFHSFLSLLRSMPDVVRIELKENGISYRVHPVYDQTTAHIQKMVFEQRDRYQAQNRLYDRCWRSNSNSNQLNFFPFEQSKPVPSLMCPPLICLPVHNGFSSWPLQPTRVRPPIVPQKLLVFNEPIRYSIVDRPRRSPVVTADGNICSTPDTFVKTPEQSPVHDRPLTEEPMLPPITSLTPPTDPPKISPSFSSTSDESIRPPKLPDSADDSVPSSESQREADVVVVEETIDLNSGAAHRSTNDSFPDRMRDALRRCLHFRYIHRLYEVKFADRFYPVTLQLVVNQSESEAIALNDYENDLNEFEQTVQRDCLVDAATCERMFNEYVSLQRNYHRMKKLMNIKTIGRTDPLRG